MQWEAIGIFDVMLPFFLIFTIIFAILQKTKIFGARKGIDVIIAMTISALTILNPFVNDILKIILQNAVIAILIIIALMLLLGLIWGAKRPEIWTYIGGMIGLVIFVWILGRVADYYEMYYPGTIIFSRVWWENNLPWIIPLLIIIIFAIVVISSSKERPSGTPAEKIWNALMERKEEW